MLGRGSSLSQIHEGCPFCNSYRPTAVIQAPLCGLLSVAGVDIEYYSYLMLPVVNTAEQSVRECDPDAGMTRAGEMNASWLQV